MKLKKVMVAAVALASAIGFASACSSKEKDTYVIGMTGPLTGGAAIYGTAVKNSAEMAVEEINAAGGLNGVKFEFVMIDDQHNKDMVATAYASLKDKGMQVSLGTVTTAPGQEFKQLAKNDNVFFMTPSATADDIPCYENGYQMCFSDSSQGTYAAKYVNENLSAQNIGILYKSDDDYSKGIYNNFKATLDSKFTQVAATFTGDPTTYDSQIQQLKNCKFIFLPIYYGPASLFMTQAKGIIDNKAVYFGCDGLDGIDSVEGFDITKIPQEVSYLSHFNSNATSGSAKTFIDKYVNKYGKDTLNQFGAAAYDCVYAIYGAMKKAQEANPDSVKPTTSASDLCNTLKGIFNNGYKFTGVTGDGKEISWANNGYVNKTAVKYVVKSAD